MTSKGEIGIREVVLLLIFLAVLVVSLLLILGVKGELGRFVDMLDIPTFKELFS